MAVQDFLIYESLPLADSIQKYAFDESSDLHDLNDSLNIILSHLIEYIRFIILIKNQFMLHYKSYHPSDD